MAYYFPEGSRFYFSQNFGASVSVTAATNANPTVLTAAAHGLVDNDEFIFTSGWEDATDMVYKADQLTTGTLSPLGLDTTDTDFYPSGSGTGTIQKVNTWTEVPQVLTIATSGGDPRFTTISPLAKRNDVNVPTGFNAASMTLTLGHDPANANFQAMQAIGRRLSPVAMKIVLGGGGSMYGYGYLSVSEIPSMTKGQVNQVSAALTMLGRPMAYAT
jgi:hypothetical protein